VKHEINNYYKQKQKGFPLCSARILRDFIPSMTWSVLPALRYFRPVRFLWGVIWRYSARRFISLVGVETLYM